jgi:16S rRNA (guanine527-N7)-methyltransferase
MNIESIFANHGFELSPQELEPFTRFLELFQAYNSHTNLSAIRDEAGIIEKHFVDSLYGASVIEELF